MAGRDYIRMQQYFDLPAIEFMNAFLLSKSGDNEDKQAGGAI